MVKNSNTTKQWMEEKVSVREKLSVLWIKEIFFYVYADIKVIFSGRNK